MPRMIQYKLLKNMEIEAIHRAYTDAFSDYQVPMVLPLSKFAKMLERRGFAQEMSMGAFADEELVGFVLNGARMWNAKRTAYNLGTGVIKPYRRQGVSNRMLRELLQLLKEKEMEQYLLEVITTNRAAVELYTKQAFEITREFWCFRAKKAQLPHVNSHPVEYADRIDGSGLADFWDLVPSWQNSIDSIQAVSESFIYACVKREDTLIGYGIVDRITGEIPHIAVDPKFRNRGVGTSLLSGLLQQTDSSDIHILNIEVQRTNPAFFHRLGFENFATQYEMVRRL